MKTLAGRELTDDEFEDIAYVGLIEAEHLIKFFNGEADLPTGIETALDLAQGNARSLEHRQFILIEIIP